MTFRSHAYTHRRSVTPKQLIGIFVIHRMNPAYPTHPARQVNGESQGGVTAIPPADLEGFENQWTLTWL